MLIEEIVVRVNDGLDLVIRWAGDDHTALRVRKNRTGQHRWSVDANVVELVRAMARQMPDMAIAAALNRMGKTTGKDGEKMVRDDERASRTRYCSWMR